MPIEFRPQTREYVTELLDANCPDGVDRRHMTGKQMAEVASVLINEFGYTRKQAVVHVSEICGRAVGTANSALTILEGRKGSSGPRKATAGKGKAIPLPTVKEAHEALEAALTAYASAVLRAGMEQGRKQAMSDIANLLNGKVSNDA